LLTFDTTQHQTSPSSIINDKVNFQMLLHAFNQLPKSQFASFFCATIIFLGLYDIPQFAVLLSWYITFITIIIARFFLLHSFFQDKQAENNYRRWKTFFLIATIAGALCWGAEGIFLFPHANLYQKTLCILVLASVTAGAIISLAAVFISAISFVVIAIVPFIISIIFLNNYSLSLYDITLTVYLIYIILLSRSVNITLHDIIVLRFSNDSLVHQLSKANLELAQMATHDPLTRMENSYLFNVNFENAINRAIRDHTQLAVLYIDIDDFKSINDRFGHMIGDLLLKEVSTLLKTTFRETDIVARLGGDEFVLVLEKIGNRVDIENIANYICNEIRRPFNINNIALNVTTSIGISLYPDNGTSKEALLKEADQAMFYVKNHGKNNFHFTE
jgi:diguanylate cyclase (GGDEF)-like protein